MGDRFMSRVDEIVVKTKKLSIKFFRIFWWIAYWLSGFFPRDKKIWLFGGWHGKRFADNSKWFYLYCSKSHRGARRYIWVTKNYSVFRDLRSRGFEVYFAYSLKGIWFCLRGGVYIFDCYSSDINFWTSRCAYKVNLWHGIPLKKIERDIDNPSHPYFRVYHGTNNVFQLLKDKIDFYNLGERYDLFISTSEEVSDLFQHAFSLVQKSVLVTGYPRNDVFFHGPHEFDGALESNRYHEKIMRFRSEGKKIIFYMPTFRDIEKREQLPFDWDVLNNFFIKHGGVLFLKLHSVDKMASTNIPERECIIELPSDIDPYPLIKFSDMLITDYSSVFFDFILLDKPILFYPYDLKEYLKTSRGMYFDYQSVTPGMKVASFTDLLSALDEIFQDLIKYQEAWVGERKRVLDRFHQYSRPGASDRIFREIELRVPI